MDGHGGGQLPRYALRQGGALITWGSTRLVYFLEEQSWATPLLCFDQEMHVTHAREQFRQIISDILKPATSAIWSNYLRKRVAQYAGQQWVANSQFGNVGGSFTYNWVVVGDEEIYIDCTAQPDLQADPADAPTARRSR